MRFNILVWLGGLLALASALAYFFSFGDYHISKHPEDWAFFGTYMGGILSPILTFISVMYLIRSLDLQKDNNQQLKQEFKNSEILNKLKSFEAKFFHLIEAQQNIFNNLELTIAGRVYKSNAAVIKLEDEIEEYRRQSKSDDFICNYIDSADRKDLLFSLSRGFSVIQKNISRSLADSEGFTTKERKEHYITLINFTDFTLLRLIMISLKFSENEANQSILNNLELVETLEEVGLIEYYDDL